MGLKASHSCPRNRAKRLSPEIKASSEPNPSADREQDLELSLSFSNPALSRANALLSASRVFAHFLPFSLSIFYKWRREGSIRLS